MFIRLQWNYAQNPYKTDSFTYSINLDLSQNIYLKTIPASILEGYCRGDWNGYYPKKEMNQCLFDDFLSRFNYFQLNVPVNSEFCTDDYCTDSYFKDMYNRFTRKLKYREIIYYDMQHSVVKREVLWFQLYFSS